MTMRSSPDDFDAVERQHERVTYFLHALQGSQFLLGTGCLEVECLEVPVDEFDRLEQPARSFTFQTSPNPPASSSIRR